MFLSLFIILNMLISVSHDRILVVDISGSMRKNNLHERVKASFKDYVKQCDKGDRVILMTFGSDVNSGIDDRVINNTQDITDLQNSIEQFQFNDQWTWMTKAFDVIARRLGDLQKAYPKRPKIVLIFTDGNNDPPPGHRSDFTFERILEMHGYTFKQENTFVYLIMLKEKPSDTLKDFVEKTGITADTTPPEERGEKVYKELALSPIEVSRSFDIDEQVSAEISLKVEKLFNLDSLPLRLSISEEGPLKVKLATNSFMVKEKRQTLETTLEISNIKEKGKFSFYLVPEPGIRGVIVTPDRIKFNSEFKEPLVIPAWVWIALIASIVIIFSLVFYFKSIETIPEGYTLSKLDSEGRELVSFDLSEYNKASITPKDLGVEELTSKAFILYIKSGIMYLKAGNVEEIKVKGREEPLEPGEEIELYNGKEFNAGSLNLKFKTEEIL